MFHKEARSQKAITLNNFWLLHKIRQVKIPQNTLPKKENVSKLHSNKRSTTNYRALRKIKNKKKWSLEWKATILRREKDEKEKSHLSNLTVFRNHSCCNYSDLSQQQHCFDQFHYCTELEYQFKNIQHFLFYILDTHVYWILMYLHLNSQILISVVKGIIPIDDIWLTLLSIGFDNQTYQKFSGYFDKYLPE